MMVIAKGQCMVELRKSDLCIEPVHGVLYNHKQVYINTFHGVSVGRYKRAYTYENNVITAIGEIKFTTGSIENGCLVSKYVLCEY